MPEPSHRAPIAKHAVLRSPRILPQVLTLVGVVLAVVLVSVSSVATFALWNTEQALQSTSVDIDNDDALPPTIGEIEGGTNVLLVGTDSCEGQDVALFPRCAEDEGGERNDVTMLINISDDPRRVTVVSFPRDMLVSIPECTGVDGSTQGSVSSMKINASYNRGGLACTVKTVEKLTGVPVQFAAGIRWTGVINVSDAIGGVDVCVAGDISDGNTGLQLSAGTHTLQGAQALQFLRIRHGIGDGSDLGRISNQQQFMSSLVRKLQNGAVFTDPGRLFSLATTAMQQVTQKQMVLSQGLANPTRMVQIAMALKSVPFKDFVFVQYPTRYGNGGVYPISDDADTLFQAIADNKGITLTGEASAGYGVEVTGEATPAVPAPTASATSEATAQPAPADESVALPKDVTGTTAEQVTCTVPQK